MTFIKLTVIGSGNAFCSGGRFNSCYYVEWGGKNILLDCGPTSLAAIRKCSLDPMAVDIIVISHLHGDHIAGIPFLVLEAYKADKRKKPLTIIIPPDGERRIKEVCAILYPDAIEMFQNLDIRFVQYSQNEEIEIEGFSMKFFEVSHNPLVKPHGFRIEKDSKVLAYSGDTGWTDNLYSIADKSDLFICECNFYEKETLTHLNYKKLVAEQQNLKAKRMLLTHFGKESLSRYAEIIGEKAEDGKCIEF
jgi:ribonuclease BN (tRNA processing enzyme)